MLDKFEDVMRSASAEQLHGEIREIAGSLGFESFHFACHLPEQRNGRTGQAIFEGSEQKSDHVLSDYPDAWFARYQEQKYIGIDPVVAHCTRSVIPLIWHRQPNPAAPGARQMFDEARQHGLATGITYSLFGKGGEAAIFSLTSSVDTAPEHRAIEMQLGQGYMLMSYAHEAMKRLCLHDAPAPVALTPRERECLQWVGAGKTSWEIAQILALAERTAIFHINNAAQKLGTNTRAQAVARAISLGLLDL